MLARSVLPERAESGTKNESTICGLATLVPGEPDTTARL